MNAATTANALAGTVQDLLGITVTVPDADPGDVSAFTNLAGFAVRDNPRRAHLIVSKVLGKHIPADPHQVLAAGHLLARQVAAVTDPDPSGRPHAPADSLVVGYCETATGLGHAVAEALHVTYLHTTRKEHPDLPVQARFDEEHSHAVGHLIQPAPGVSLAGHGPLILVDDELTSGKTALNTIEAIHAEYPRPGYVIATLLDARTPAGRRAFADRVATMGVTVHVVSLLSAYLTLPEDVLDRAVAARDRLPDPAPAPAGPPAQVHIHPDLWPADRPVTARHGMTHEQSRDMRAGAAALAQHLAAYLPPDGSVLVLGTEELLHLPTLTAAEIANWLPEATVRNQSTTRSPVHAADDPGYAVRRTVTFPAPDDPSRVSRVHNLIDPAATPTTGAWADLRHTDIVVIADADPVACGPMVQALRPFASRTVHLVPVPPTTASH